MLPFIEFIIIDLGLIDNFLKKINSLHFRIITFSPYKSQVPKNPGPPAAIAPPLDP